MNRSALNGLTLFGALLALAGIIVLSMPVFTTQQTHDLARLGDLKVQTTETHWHEMPPALGGGVLALGVVLVCAGLFVRR